MDVYEKLRAMLDTHPAGCPEAPGIIEILKMLFTEEEAAIALGLGFSPFPVETIARRAKAGKEETLRHLEALADKGMVFTVKKGGKTLYGIVPTMPGLFEFPFMKAQPGDFLDRLSELWRVYMPELSQCMGSPSMPISRVIPIEEQVSGKPGVLPYEKIYEMIDRARVVGIGKCACRTYGKNCDNPVETCMVFDNMCEYLASRKIARIITKDEMKKILRQCDEAGLVHQMNNSQDKIDIICNCCPCCCALLKCINTYGNPHAVNKSGFIPVNDAEKCTLCGVCADERCPMTAITIENQSLSVDKEKCIGCGLCVTGCPEKAMTLVRSKDWKKPVEKEYEIGMAILKERGKEKDILPFLDPDADPLK